MNLDNNFDNTSKFGDVLSNSPVNKMTTLSSRKQIVIAGAGSIGTIMGLLLSRQGHDIKLIRKRGEFGRLRINVIGVEEFSEEIDVFDISIEREKLKKISPDLIILAPQRQQLPLQLRQLQDIIGFENLPIIFPIQNGLGTADLVCRWMKENHLELPVVQAVIWWSATLIDSYNVLYHNKAMTTIGIPRKIDCTFTKIKHQEEIFKIIDEILEVKIIDIDKEPYIKLILNVVSPILALVKMPYPTGLNDLTVRKIIKLLFDEAIEIAKNEGWYEPDERLDRFYKILSGSESLDHYSMHQNLPHHKVSSQISAEKYGGKGSNVTELLSYFVERGGRLCERVMNLFLSLESNYLPFSSSELMIYLVKD